MTKRALPDPIISDAEIAARLERGELVKLPDLGEAPANAQKLAELRRRMPTSRQQRRVR